MGLMRFAGTSSPRSSPGTATASQPRRSARESGSSSSSCGRPTTSTSSIRTPAQLSSARAGNPRARAAREERRRAGRRANPVAERRSGRTVLLGWGARGKARIKVRRPLGEAVIVAEVRERGAIEKLADVVREGLNVRRIRFVAAADELGSYDVKANCRSLGPLFGKDMPLVADAIAALDPARVAAAVRGGREIGIAVNGHEHTLSASDLIVTIRAP